MRGQSRGNVLQSPKQAPPSAFARRLRLRLATHRFLTPGVSTEITQPKGDAGSLETSSGVGFRLRRGARLFLRNYAFAADFRPEKRIKRRFPADASKVRPIPRRHWAWVHLLEYREHNYTSYQTEYSQEQVFGEPVRKARY